jgi:hypothetical protein
MTAWEKRGWIWMFCGTCLLLQVYVIRWSGSNPSEIWKWVVVTLVAGSMFGQWPK